MPKRTTFAPMLACREQPDLEALRYPIMLSPKLDGIRCVIQHGEAVSRTLKAIPNYFVRKELAGLPDGLDGELLVPGMSFNEVQSAIMSRDGEPDFVFNVFDWAPDGETAPLGFRERLAHARLLAGNFARIQPVPHEYANDPTGVQMREEHYVGLGFEGLILRDPQGPYKFGRSTMNEGWMLKLKRFEDAEAEVVGAVERMHNENELEQDALGHAKRSHAKDGKVPAGDLGALVCKSPLFTETFEVGTGFTAKQRLHLWWDFQAEDSAAGHCGVPLLGRTITFKYQPHGTKDRPRCPVFKGFRED